MKKTDKIQLKKGDYLLLVGMTIVVIVLLVFIHGNTEGNLVHVSIKGKTTTYSLLKNRTITLSNEKEYDPLKNSAHITNQLVIENGVVYMEQADCPDQICVKHKAISKNGEMIICLPNEVYVEVESSVDNEVDN